ncbi:MAG: GTP-binding protein, partial [Polyangiaceae bacterium]
MRVHVLGGFLGAGKTTAAVALTRRLSARGERVAVVTNDQGHGLVDSVLCAEVTDDLTEIGGGCFCCRYGELEEALDAAHASGATVALAEAVGSCTDLVATVMAPLADRERELRLAPLSVLVDPWRAEEIAQGRFGDDVRYLFEKQIEEADVVVLTRSDLDPPDVEPFIRGIRADVPIVRVAATTGMGLDEWLATIPNERAVPLVIDYDRYAAAEALLGWANGRVAIHRDEPFEPALVVERFLECFAGEPVAHLKVVVQDPASGSANLVRQGAKPELRLERLPEQCTQLMLVVNARVARSPADLEATLRAAIDRAAPGARTAWSQLSCFAPARPVPVHRYSQRVDAEEEASCCAAFYERPDVRYLLGDSFHPGGARLTLEMAAQLGLEPGAKVLDVACGRGESLRAIAAEHAISPVGMDVAPPPEPPERDAGEPRVAMLRGDAHHLPFESESFDAAICECALSTFSEQPRALAEMFRVLRPGGRLGVSDMVVSGPIASGLADWVHVGTCLSHARPLAGYAALIEHAGFTIVEEHDATWALSELLSGIKRRLLGAALGKASGLLPAGVE